MNFTAASKVPVRLLTSLALVAGVVMLLGAPAAADTTAQSLPFGQNWSNTGLITTANDWSAVPGIIGYRGDGLAAATGVDPQTITADGSATPVNVIANQTNPNTLATGGIAEFDTLPNPVVAFQGSVTARAPHLVVSLNTTGLSTVTVSYNLRDVDGALDNSVQPVALQYRIGASGSYTNVPAGFVADASTGPSAATQVTPVNAVLPLAAGNQALVQVRMITADAVGSDEWIGVDDISVTGSSASTNPSGFGTASPSTVAPGGSTLLTVNVTPGTSPASTGLAVSCNLTAIGGSAGQAFTDNGVAPDATAGDNIFSFQATVASGTTTGAKNMPCSITDAQARSGSAAINLTVSAPAAPSPLVVSEVYGGGGNTGATYKNDFIELYNPTGSSVSLAGWSVQYGSSGGTTWQVTALSGSIPPGRNYLVQEAAGTGGTTALPGPDAFGTIAMSGTAGKVALVSSTTALSGACPASSAFVDLVGYGAANCSETAPTPALSNTTSAQRKGGGATDTNNNFNDFIIGAPDPHGTVDPGPTVVSTTPGAGAGGVATDANVSITFSEPVNVSGSWFTINCGTSGSHTATVSGGPTTFVLDPSPNFSGNETCTVTVLAANVTDQDTVEPHNNMTADYNFSFQTDVFICGDPATLIHDVQGSGPASPMVGAPVTIEGIVVGDYQATSNEFGGFYLQEETADADGDALTSEGVFVFDNGFGVDVAPGDVVRVRGTVTEFFSLTEINNVSAVQGCSTDASVPATSVGLPVADVADLEAFESMLVHFAQTLTTTEVFTLGRFGEVSLSAGGRLYTPTAVAAPGAAAQAQQTQNLRSRIILDDGNSLQNIDPTRYPAGGLSASNTLRVGDTLSSLTGVMDFRFSNYRIQPVGAISFSPTNPRISSPPAVDGNLKVASFNVLNYFNGDGAGGGYPTPRGANTAFEFDRQRTKIISAISAIDADVVGLMEIENDPTPSSAIEDLVAGLNAAMGAGTYAFIDTGVVGTDEIRVALIYKPAAVAPVGPYKILDSTVDPRFIDTRSRPALAQTFAKPTGARVTVIVNHLKSKGSACAGDPDTGDGQGNCNVTRTQAAEALVDWIAGDPTGSGDSDFLVMGDLNAYTFEDPITVFTDNGYTNLVRHFGGLAAYSYVFDGGSGYLDHALATPSLTAQTTSVTDWHINADEPIVLDYNIESKTAGQVSSFYSPGPFRSSDHDPVIIGLQLNTTPTVSAGGPYSIAEGGSGTLTATGNDPDGDTLTYDWDLDNDGDFDDATGQSVTFSAASIDGPASQTVRVRATDSSGASAIDSTTVNVTNVAPTATFNAPASNPAGFAFTLSLTDPDDAAPADEPTLTYAFDCGDGGGYGPFTASNSAVCPTTSAGTRNVGGKVKDDDGGVTEYNDTVTSTVTYSSLCLLVQLYSSDEKLADKLCRDLEKAEGEAADGKNHTHLEQFRKEVEKNKGGAFSDAEAAILLALADALEA